ncbi:MAG: hypothetical protein AAGK17_01145 [Pseudomonadota bacterium]
MPSANVPKIFNQRRRRLRFERSKVLSQRPNAACWLDNDLIADILDRIDFMRLSSGKCVVLGDLNETLAAHLNQLSFPVEQHQIGSFNEEQPWPLSCADYIFAIRTLSTLNDLPGALLHLRNALLDGGILFAQIIGAGSLPTLRSIMMEADGDSPAARIHPQIDNQAASALLARAGFSKQVVDSRSITVRFSSFDRMIGDLREQGLTGILNDCPPRLTKAALARARKAFEARRDDEGKVSENFEILALTGWR